MNVQNAVLLAETQLQLRDSEVTSSRNAHISHSLIRYLRRDKWAVRSASMVSWHVVMVQFFACCVSTGIVFDVQEC